MEDLAASYGHMELLHYKGGANMKWSASDIKKYSNALVSGLAEIGHNPGTRIASMLNPSVAEHHCTQFACAEAGYVFVSIDPQIDDPILLNKILSDNQVKTLVYSGNDREIELINQAVPEFDNYRSRQCKPFFSSTLPHIRFFITIGLDMQPGALPIRPSHNYQHFLAYDGVQPSKATLDGEIISVDYSDKGKVRKQRTQEEVVQDKFFPARAPAQRLGEP
ncbi:hypothetical protein M885DRAFT_557183 [Pelagophyceae sp. CCMP2097]|nr:hypothetical protein M885DRAFT_557183 [Pelagophyceae sp. CCMP2097]